MPLSFRTVAAAGLLTLAGTVGGAYAAQSEAPAKPGSMDTARVSAGTYTADAAHTLVGWRVNHFGFNDYFGQFGDVSGSLTLDPKAPEKASVVMTIPFSGLTTASAKLTEHMMSADFFDNAKFAGASFRSTKVEVNGTRARITGMLEIKGTAKPVTLDAEFTGAGINPFNKKETIGFHATTMIKRSDFGVAYGIPLVSDEVKLDITAAFEK